MENSPNSLSAVRSPRSLAADYFNFLSRMKKILYERVSIDKRAKLISFLYIMSLTIKPEYIKEYANTKYIEFYSASHSIIHNNKYCTNLEVCVGSIRHIKKHGNNITMKFGVGYGKAELRAKEFIHMFNDSESNESKIEKLSNDIVKINDKLDKMCAHIMTLMVAAEALPKDFDGEFP